MKIPACWISHRNAVSSPIEAVTVNARTTSNTPSSNLLERVSKSSLTSGVHSFWKIAGELGVSNETSFV